MLLNRSGGQRVVEVTQDALPLSPRHRIARADVAEAFVAALDHPRATRATFEVVWGHGNRREAWFSRAVWTARPSPQDHSGDDLLITSLS